MRLRRFFPAFVAAMGFGLAGCDVDKLLEAEVPPEIHLAISVTATTVSLAPGGTATLQSSITRLGDYTGSVEFEFANVPDGVTAELSAPSTSGSVTSTSITFRALPTAGVGTFSVTIAAKAGGTRRTAQQVALLVVEAPSIGVFPSRASVIVIRGGIAPFNVALSRTNFTGAVTLALTGAPSGVTLDLTTNPVTTSNVTGTLSIASTVAPGTYNAKVRATGSGVADVESPVSIIVSPDPIQLIADDANGSQASVVTSQMIVNRFGVSGAVTFTATGLPAGTTVTFSGGTGTTASARFLIGSAVVPGAYGVTLRAQSAGLPDATVGVVLNVAPSNVAMSLVPQAVSVLQGAGTASAINLIRTAYSGAVSVEFSGLPAGLVLESSDLAVTGSQAVIIVNASREVAPGLYTITVRAIPAPSEIDGPALDPVTAPLLVTVMASPPGSGNVVLDWSGCAAPGWVAGRDGAGPWTVLQGTGGVFRFSLTSQSGGYAFVDGGTQTIVRFATLAELTAGPISLCPPPQAGVGKTLNAIAEHTNAADRFLWQVGGGSGTSTLAAPNFAISGVQDGTHDLIGISTAGTQQSRLYIRRDLNEPAGANIGTVTLVGPGSFNAQATNLTITPVSNERLTVGINYLTTTACTLTPLTSSSTTGATTGAIGWLYFAVPASQQRASDFHNVDVVAIGATNNTTRTMNVSFNRAATRSIPLPAFINSSISTIGGAYFRMRATLTGLPAAYNRTATLRYSDGSRQMTITASTSGFAGGVGLVEMPDLSLLPGFPSTAPVALGAHGTWSLTVDGGSLDTTRCAEEATRFSIVRNGVF
jgi:hypothetical protein